MTAESTAMVGFWCAYLMSYFQELNNSDVRSSSPHAVILMSSHAAGGDAVNQQQEVAVSRTGL